MVMHEGCVCDRRQLDPHGSAHEEELRGLEHSVVSQGQELQPMCVSVAAMCVAAMSVCVHLRCVAAMCVWLRCLCGCDVCVCASAMCGSF